MDVRQVVLAASAFRIEDFPADRRPEVAFLGRSNVGKSSLINRLLGRKRLARTSSTPGKTRGIFFYLVNEAFYLVDLPGYGYAGVSRTIRESWAPLIEGYLKDRPMLGGCVHLIDIRHSPSQDDQLMRDWLSHYRVPRVTVATKADKFSRGAGLNRLSQLRRELKLPAEEPLLPFSSPAGTGKYELWAELKKMLSAFDPPTENQKNPDPGFHQ